jgi:hypothetical protein
MAYLMYTTDNKIGKQTFLHCDQTADRNNLREERFGLLKALVHLGGERMVKQLKSW